MLVREAAVEKRSTTNWEYTDLDVQLLGARGNPEHEDEHDHKQVPHVV